MNILIEDNPQDLQLDIFTNIKLAEDFETN